MTDTNSLWRDRNKVFVAGIPAHADDDALYHKFSTFGEMFQSKVVRDARTGASKGFGFLTFATYEHALEAVSQMNQAKWANRVLNVRFLQPKPETGNGDAVAGASADSAAAARNRPAKILGPCPPGCTTVYAGNLAYGITEPVLRKVFASCGDVKAVRFADHIETKEFRGFGHVQFYDSAACEKAVQLDGMVVMGRPMNLDYGSRDEATEKAREELQRKLKKGVCHKFQSGDCPRGDDCKFAHVLSAQNAERALHAVPRVATAVAVERPTVVAQVDETPVCQSFLKGKCKRGDKCKFQHVEAGAMATTNGDNIYHTPEFVEADETEEVPPVCQSFLSGKCKRGDKCKFRHVDEGATPITSSYEAPRSSEDGTDETPVCQGFLKGKCKRGDKCKFRHVDTPAAAAVPHVAAPPVRMPVTRAPMAVAGSDVPICLNFQKGTCNRGDACRFRHVDAPVEPTIRDSSIEPTEVTRQARAAEETEADADAPICQSYLKGKCKRGAKCRFRHVAAVDTTDAPVVVPTLSICQNFQRGRCLRGSSCRFAHTAEVDQEGEAAYTQPQAAGVPDSVVAAPVSTAHSDYQKRFQSVCYNWQNKRSCVRGDACPFYHDGATTATATTATTITPTVKRRDDDEEENVAVKKEKKDKKEKKSKKRKADTSDSDSDSDKKKTKKKKKTKSKSDE